MEEDVHNGNKGKATCILLVHEDMKVRLALRDTFMQAAPSCLVYVSDGRAAPQSGNQGTANSLPEAFEMVLVHSALLDERQASDRQVQRQWEGHIQSAKRKVKCASGGYTIWNDQSADGYERLYRMVNHQTVLSVEDAAQLIDYATHTGNKPDCLCPPRY